MGSLTGQKDQPSSDRALHCGCVLVVLWGFLKLELCSVVFPKAAAVSTLLLPVRTCKVTAAAPSLEPSCAPPCWETPRLVRDKVCQQPEQPARSSRNLTGLALLESFVQGQNICSWNWSNRRNCTAKPGLTAWTPSWHLCHLFPSQGSCAPCRRHSKTKLLSGPTPESHSLKLPLTTGA